MYALDEPSIGLHQRGLNDRLDRTRKHLRDRQQRSGGQPTRT